MHFFWRDDETRGETVTALQFLAIYLALAGIASFVDNAQAKTAYGGLFMIASGICAGLATVLA